MKQNKQDQRRDARQTLYTSLLLALIAIVSVTAATTAWLTIGDRTRVHSMAMDVTAGPNIRFDLDPHDTIEEYVHTLTFSDIASRLMLDRGFDATDTPLQPVTTEDYVHFTLQDGTEVPPEDGSFLEFTLHFMATKDVVVHLTSENSDDALDGTAVTSSVGALPPAMRISFTDGNTTYVYDPGMENTSVEVFGAKNFGLPSAANMTYTDDNAMFSLKEGENKPIVVHIWLEGEDPQCTDELQSADYQIQLRFQATDENNTPLRESR